MQPDELRMLGLLLGKSSTLCLSRLLLLSCPTDLQGQIELAAARHSASSCHSPSSQEKFELEKLEAIFVLVLINEYQGFVQCMQSCLAAI